MKNISTIFISYSRKDTKTAKWLENQLLEKNFKVLIDLSEIIIGEEWWLRLQELILQADQVIFLMSFNSVNSAVCNEEIKYAKSLNKRIFPVLIDNIDWGLVPEGLSKIQSIYLDASVENNIAIDRLTSALTLNLQWVKEHTRLLNRASNWKLKHEIDEELLFGKALIEAEEWLVSESPSNVFPTILHQEYINHSRKIESGKRDEELKRVEEQNYRLKIEKDKAENNFRAGLDVISDFQYHIINNLKNIRGVSTTTQEYILNVMISASERLKNNDPEFYPSSVQMQLSQNDLTAKSFLIEIYVKQGKFNKAQEISEEALKLANEFYFDDYNPLQRRPGLRQIASILSDISRIYFEKRDVENALKYLLESKDLQKRCIEYYSKFKFVEDFREDLIDSLHRECVCYLYSGNKLKSLETAKEARKELAYLINNSNGQRDYTMMSNIVDFLVGDSLAENGQYNEAEELIIKVLSTFDESLATNPDNINLLHKKSLCLERLGNIEALSNQTNNAIDIYEQALMIKQLLIEADPSNIQYRNDFAIIANKIKLLKRNNK